MQYSSEDIAILANKVRKLEAIESIRALKARYLNACDQKRPQDVRSCFADGAVTVDTDYMGVFNTADEFVEMYTKTACHPHVYDKHQCGNAEITISDECNASAVWCLDFRNINTKENTVTLMRTFYHEKYKIFDGNWKITYSKTEFKSVFVGHFIEGALIPLLAGASFASADFRSDNQFVARALAGVRSGDEIKG